VEKPDLRTFFRTVCVLNNRLYFEDRRLGMQKYQYITYIRVKFSHVASTHRVTKENQYTARSFCDRVDSNDAVQVFHNVV